MRLISRSWEKPPSLRNLRYLFLSCEWVAQGQENSSVADITGPFLLCRQVTVGHLPVLYSVYLIVCPVIMQRITLGLALQPFCELFSYLDPVRISLSRHSPDPVAIWWHNSSNTVPCCDTKEQPQGKETGTDKRHCHFTNSHFSANTKMKLELGIPSNNYVVIFPPKCASWPRHKVDF